MFTPLHSDHITEVRAVAAEAVAVYNRMIALQNQRNALGLGDNIDNGLREEADEGATPAEIFGDFQGANQDIDVVKVTAFFVTVGAFTAMMDAGNATNLHKVAKAK